MATRNDPHDDAHQRKTGEHHETTLVRPQVITRETDDVLFPSTKKLHERHCNKLKGSDMQYGFCFRTTFGDQAITFRRERRDGKGKNAATFNTIPPQRSLAV